MFESSQLNGKNRKRFGLAMVLSTSLQVVALTLAILIPLFTTNTLTAIALGDKLLLPPPPPPAEPPVKVFTPDRDRKEKLRPTENKASDKFTAPREIPNFKPVPEPEAPPRDNNRGPGGVIGGVPNGTGDRMKFPFPIDPGPEAAPPPPPLPAPPVQPPQKPTRVGGNVQESKLVSQIKPVYPVLARQARVQGVVVLEAVIDREGAITNLKVITGHPLLVQAAVDAVRQWRYKPTLLNGEPVEVVTTITVNFAFAQ